jgi:hypothetical protein
MDEVGDFDLRRHLTSLSESFGSAYPQCRVVVTSRFVGYTGPARLGGFYHDEDPRFHPCGCRIVPHPLASPGRHRPDGAS